MLFLQPYLGSGPWHHPEGPRLLFHRGSAIVMKDTMAGNNRREMQLI